MALIVQKYGGSSVADTAKIRSVARRVGDTATANQVVVVVSAMGKTTDGLVSLAQQIAPTPEPRELDMLLATGEQVTIALLAMALHDLGSQGALVHRRAGGDAHGPRAHQGPHHADHRRPRARRAGRRLGGGGGRLPGRQRRRRDHHARAAAAPT